MMYRLLLFFFVSFSNLTFANEQQWREMQQDLQILKLYQGEIDGQLNDGFKVAIDLYLKNKKISWTMEEVISDPSKLIYDLDLEERLYSRKSIFEKAVEIKTPRAKIQLLAYQHSEETLSQKKMSQQSWRLIVNEELILAGHIPFNNCCKETVYSFSDHDIILLKGKGNHKSCGTIEILLVVDDKKSEILGSPRVCAPPIRLEQRDASLIMIETNKQSLLNKHFRLLKTGEQKFERFALNSALAPIASFEGKSPLTMNNKGERALYFPPLLEALTELLDPESLGWVLKMNTENRIERRGNLLFINGQYKEDETHLTVTLDIAKNAVHLCTIKGGVTRFVSTLLEKSFSDPDSSCPLNIEEAENIWKAMDVLDEPSSMRVFSFEGTYQFTDDADDKLILKAREATLPDGRKCMIEGVSVVDKGFMLDTSCQTLSVKLIKDNRYVIDGDEATKQ